MITVEENVCFCFCFFFLDYFRYIMVPGSHCVRN